MVTILVELLIAAYRRIRGPFVAKSIVCHHAFGRWHDVDVQIAKDVVAIFQQHTWHSLCQHSNPHLFIVFLFLYIAAKSNHYTHGEMKNWKDLMGSLGMQKFHVERFSSFIDPGKYFCVIIYCENSFCGDQIVRAWRQIYVPITRRGTREDIMREIPWHILKK